MSPVRSATYWTAVVAGALGGFIVAGTLLPVGWVIPDGLVFGIFVLALALFGLTVLREVSAGRTADVSRLLKQLPPPRRIALMGTWVLLWLCAVSSIFGLDGQPSVRDGRYLLSNHGEETVVDRQTYERARNRSARLFSSGACAFCLGAAVGSKYGGSDGTDDDQAHRELDGPSGQ